jgi:hypothetical protein
LEDAADHRDCGRHGNQFLRLRRPLSSQLYRRPRRVLGRHQAGKAGFSVILHEDVLLAVDAGGEHAGNPGSRISLGCSGSPTRRERLACETANVSIVASGGDA